MFAEWLDKWMNSSQIGAFHWYAFFDSFKKPKEYKEWKFLDFKN